MASVFGHAVVAIALTKTLNKSQLTGKLFLLAIMCAIIPDADVIGFKFDIAYDSFWGHRGFSHSLLFSLLLATFITLAFFHKGFNSKEKIIHILFFTLCTASHSILDAMTNGGLGVAFFSPWDTSRYFFSWRPIEVSPIGIRNFFTERGWYVVLSEMLWIGIPSFLSLGLFRCFKKEN